MNATNRNTHHGVSLRLAVTALGVWTATASPGVVVVDNADPGFTILRGTWNIGAFGVPRGTNYRWCSVTGGTATGEAEWRPTIPQSGTYEVAVWYIAGTNRSTNAPFVIEHILSSDTVRIDQQVSGSHWVVLDRYGFGAGTSGCVRLNNSATPTGAVVIADTVRFRSLSADFNLDGGADLDDFSHFQACYNGPNQPWPVLTPMCDDADFDCDADVMQDAAPCPLLSDEGTIANARNPY